MLHDQATHGEPLDAARALLPQIAQFARERGLQLCGAVAVREFDATQPAGRRAVERRSACGTLLVLASGGRSCWERVVEAHGGQLETARPGYHPIDAWSRAIADAVIAMLHAAGLGAQASYPDEPQPLNFRQLAEQAGLGTISPVLGHLLHPEYGPWVSLRVAILIDGTPFGERPGQALEFEPCTHCDRPCVRACPAEVYATGEGALLERCATHRLAGGCRDGCATLRACPLGAAHRYGPAEERFRSAYSLFAMRRWLGVGRWKFVPQRWRRRP